jgi:hypothetical protein
MVRAGPRFVVASASADQLSCIDVYIERERERETLHVARIACCLLHSVTESQQDPGE